MEYFEYDKNLVKDNPKWLEYLLTREVLITINKWNIEHLTKIGYENLRQNTKWTIPVNHLMTNSSMRIECVCECGNITKTSFQKFMMNYNRSNSYNCKACNNITYKKSMLEKYGYDNPAKIESSIKKRKETCLEKYGNEYVINSDYSKEKTKIIFDEKYDGHPLRNIDIKNKIIKKSKITKIERGLVVPDEELNKWELYRRNIRNITNRNKKKLMEDWDGFDYYDGEYIKDNFNIKHTDYDYPTIDHKISIICGFKNNIPPDIIGDISNLCITKKGINSSKSFLTEDNYNKKSQS